MSMSCDQRLCPGVGGCRCGAFMSPLFRDPHPIYARCRGVRCTADVTCDIFKGWSVAQWEAFLKKRPCSSRRKHRSSGSSLPPVPQTSPPCASSSSEAPLPVSPPPSEGLDRQGGGGGGVCPSRGPSRGSPSLFPLIGGWDGGKRRECFGFWGRAGFGCLFPHGGGGSGIFALPGVPCDCRPCPGSVFQLSRP